jgi:hypothetical protein
MTLIFHSQNGHVGALFTSQTSQGAPLVPCFERLLSEIAGLLGHAGERSPDVVAALLGSDFSFQLVLYLGRPSVFSSFTVGCGHSMKATSQRKKDASGRMNTCAKKRTCRQLRNSGTSTPNSDANLAISTKTDAIRSHRYYCMKPSTSSCVHLREEIPAKDLLIYINRGLVNGWICANGIFGRCIRIQSTIDFHGSELAVIHPKCRLHSQRRCFQRIRAIMSPALSGDEAWPKMSIAAFAYPVEVVTLLPL